MRPPNCLTSDEKGKSALLITCALVPAAAFGEVARCKVSAVLAFSPPRNMGRRQRNINANRKGVFNPDDADRVKHLKMGVWDLYRERDPELEKIPGSSRLDKYLEMKRNLPFVWRMLKDIGSIKSCWPLLMLYLLLEVMVSLIPAAALWYLVSI